MTVPDLDAQVDRLTTTFGLVVVSRTDYFAVISDPVSGLKIELSHSTDDAVHFRHLGFRADDVDSAHASLLEAGMETERAPVRQEFAHMYTSYLRQPGGIEVQLVRYDEPAAEPSH